MILWTSITRGWALDPCGFAVAGGFGAAFSAVHGTMNATAPPRYAQLRSSFFGVLGRRFGPRAAGPDASVIPAAVSRTAVIGTTVPTLVLGTVVALVAG